MPLGSEARMSHPVRFKGVEGSLEEKKKKKISFSIYRKKKRVLTGMYVEILKTMKNIGVIRYSYI